MIYSYSKKIHLRFFFCLNYLVEKKNFIAIYRLHMDSMAAGSPQEVIEKVSKQLGCSTTSRDVAQYFDRHDKLRDLRREFLVPQIADLPPCKSFTVN